MIFYLQKLKLFANSIYWEHNYAQQQFSGWEFSIESQTEGCKKPIMNIHYEYTLVEVNIH